MTVIPAAVQNQALHPFAVLPRTGQQVTVETDLLRVLIHPLPLPQLIDPKPTMRAEDLDVAVAQAREIVRGHGHDTLIWQAGPDHPWLRAALTAACVSRTRRDLNRLRTRWR